MSSFVTGAAVSPVAATANVAGALFAPQDTSTPELGLPSPQAKEAFKPVHVSAVAAEALSSLQASTLPDAGSTPRPWEEQHGPFWPGQIPWFTDKELKTLRTTDSTKAIGAETEAASAQSGGADSSGLTAAIASAQSQALASHAAEPVDSPGASVPPSSDYPTRSELTQPSPAPAAGAPSGAETET